jgi:sodium/pantothenate symporter
MLAWSLFLLYMLGITWLGWVGHRRTADFSSFAIGRGDLSPFVVGVTLAASTASAATFIINPGFIYVHGVAAWMHFVPATWLGFCTMLVLLSFRFRRIGERSGALTIPHWIGQRYRSRAFALYFALINLLAVAFAVLIVGGISIVMQRLLGISNVAALLIVLTSVTAYVFVGGTYAHVFTNLLQGVLMIGVAALVLGTGLQLFISDAPGFFDAIRAQDPALLAAVNPGSPLYNSVFSIYVAGFIVGAAVVCQPHILTKALYVRSDRAVRDYILIFAGIFALFALLVSVGFYARVVLSPDQLVDATTGAFRQDLVMTVYLQEVLPNWVFTVVSVVLLAAAMSTLDGIMIGVATITANDLVLNVIDRKGGGRLTQGERQRLALHTSKVVLLALAAVTFLICLDPPRLLGIFGQVGVYGMVAAAVPPLLTGVLFARASLRVVWVASATALAVHLGLFFAGPLLFPQATLPFANPGVGLSCALLLTVPPTLLYHVLRRPPPAGDPTDGLVEAGAVRGQ